MRSSVAQWLAPFGIVGVFLILKAWTDAGVTVGDQGVYEYASWLWSQGIWPYRDFFISHPPVHLLVSTIIIFFGGLDLTVLHLLPSFFGAFSGLLLFLIIHRTLGQRWALVALFLFLFSNSHLVHSSHFTGANVSLFFLLLGIIFFFWQRDTLAGIALGLGAGSGIYVIPAAIALLFHAFPRNRRRSVTIAVAFIATFGFLNAIFLFVAGRNFIEQVYLYHLSKGEDAAFFAGKGEVVARVFETDALLALLTFIAIPVIAVFRRKEELVRLPLTMLFVYGVFFLFLQRLFTHYFLLLLPFAVIVTVLLFQTGLRAVPHRRCVAAWIVLVLVIGGMGTSSLILFFDNRERKRFPDAGTIAQDLRSGLTGEQTIYGDFAVVPELALLSGRRIASHEIDSSIMRFASGRYDLRDVLRAIEEDNVAAVLTRPHRGIAIYPPFREYLEREFFREKIYEGSSADTVIELWRRRI